MICCIPCFRKIIRKGQKKIVNIMLYVFFLIMHLITSVKYITLSGLDLVLASGIMSGNRVIANTESTSIPAECLKTYNINISSLEFYFIFFCYRLTIIIKFLKNIING